MQDEVIEMEHFGVHAEELVFDIIREHGERMVAAHVICFEELGEVDFLDIRVVEGVFGVIPKDYPLLKMGM